MTGRMDGAKVVLLVDDDDSIRSLIAAVLEDEGYVVATAPDAASAMEWAKHIRPHVVLLDWMMPHMDGGRLGRLLNDLYGPTVPIIIISAMGQPALAAAIDEVKAFGFLAKPFDVNHLVTMVVEAAEEEAR